MNILKNYKFKKEHILVFLLMCVAFSIPFGADYIKKAIVVSFSVWILTFGFKNIISIFKENRIIQVLSALILFYFISLLWSDHQHDGWRYIRKLLIYFYIPILIFITSVNKDNIRFIMTAFIASMFINEIISYLIFFDLFQTPYSKIYGYPVGFINHIPYSVLVAFTSILILYQARFLKNRYMQIIYFIFFITMTTNLVISGGRTGYAVYFATLFIMLFSYYKVNLKNFILVLLFPIFIFFIGYHFNKDVQKRIEASFTDVNKIARNQNYNTSFGTRLASFPIAYQVLKDNNFLIGVGAGSLIAAKNETIKKYSLDKSMAVALHEPHLHNFYADTIVMLGLVGVVLLFLFIYLLWKIKIIDNEFRFVSQLIVIVFFISNFADRMLHSKETMIFFAVFISLVLSYKRIEDKK